MDKTKRLVSFTIAIVMLIMSFSTAAFAVNRESFDISDYKLEDVLYMDSYQLNALLNNFERVYDPFDTYGTTKQLTQENQISLYWTSGKLDLSEQGSHELITAKACGLLLSDKGFWSPDHNGAIIIALTISLASILPDREQEASDILFAGHFYNPKTGKNYLGNELNTARTNAKNYYNLMETEYQTNGLSELAIEYTGRMLHFIQDASEPHHAANITGINIAHSSFEKYAHDNIDCYIDDITTISNSRYQSAMFSSPSQLVYETAIEAHTCSDMVKNYFNKSKWPDAAEICLKNAVEYSALLLYNLGYFSGIPLYK